MSIYETVKTWRWYYVCNMITADFLTERERAERERRDRER